MIEDNIILQNVKNNTSSANNNTEECDLKEKEKVNGSEVSLE